MDLQKEMAEKYQGLFNLMHEQHGLTLTSEEMDEIIHQAIKVEKKFKTLHLIVKKLPFDVMVTGEKTKEFRKPSKWINSRLDGKKYDFIKITNGYSKSSPYFIAYFRGWSKSAKPEQATFSNGLTVNITSDTVTIYIGEIIEIGNLKCDVCKSTDSVEFLRITNCSLCKKCQKDLSKAFNSVNKSRKPL